MRVLNIRNGEIVPHRILFVDGICDSRRRPSSIEISFSSAKNTTTSAADRRRITVDVDAASGRFRCFIDLELGENNLCLISGGATDNGGQVENLTLTVVYEPASFFEHVRLLYVIPSDYCGSGDLEEFESRISLAAEILQLFIAEEIRRRYNKRLTFRLENGPICRILNVRRNAARRTTSVEFYWAVVEAIFKSDSFNPKAKYLAFHCLCDDNGEKGVVETNLGCGDVALVHATDLKSWPERLEDVQRTMFLQRQYEDPQNGVDASSRDQRASMKQMGGYAAALGAALHELCHSLDLVHSSSGVMGHEFAYLHQRFLIDSYGGGGFVDAVQQPEASSNRCSLDNGQIALLRYHWWLNGRPKDDDVEEITIRNGCVVCPDGIVFAELRKDGCSVMSWYFDIYKPTLWSPPDQVSEVLQRDEDDENCRFLLALMSSKGLLKKLKKL